MADVLIQAKEPFQESLAQAGQTEFGFDFVIFDPAHLLVYVDNVLQTGGYSVVPLTSWPGTGKVVFAVGRSDGERIGRERSAPIQRLSDFKENGDLRAGTLNNELDYLTILLQDQALLNRRGLRQPSNETPVQTLPAVAERAGRVFAFDDAGEPSLLASVELGSEFIDVETFTTTAPDTSVTLAHTPLSDDHVFVEAEGRSQSDWSRSGNVLTLTGTPAGLSLSVKYYFRAPTFGIKAASEITYMPPWAGAAQRFVSQVLSGFPSIEDFGADSAAADNTAAINAALAATGGLRLPFGKRFLLKGALTRTGPLHLTGGGSLVWTDDAASLGLTVTLTTGDNFGDKVVIQDVQFRTQKLAEGVALTVDCSAANAPVGRAAPYGRVIISGAEFRGDVAPSVDGWLENVLLKAPSNAFIEKTVISGCLDAALGAGEAGIATDFGIRCDEAGEPTAHIVISEVVATYCDIAVSTNGSEGVFVDKCNLIAVNQGVKATNALGTGEPPHISVTNSHINARFRSVDITDMAQLFVKGNLFYERSSAATASIAVGLTDCADGKVEDNIVVGNRVTTGQDYHACVISGASQDIKVRNNHWKEVTIGGWAQVGTDRISFIDNEVYRESVLGIDPVLYVNNSAGDIVIDSKVFSGKSAADVTAGSGTLVDIDMGAVHLGQKFMVTAKATHTKGVTGGFTTTAVLKGAGTATVRFVHDDTELRTRHTQAAGAVDDHTLSGLMTVTAPGTLTLRCQFTSDGSSATILAGEAQLSAIQIGRSGRVV